MRPRPRLLIVSAIVLIAILAIIVNLPRKGRIDPAPGMDETVSAFPTATPTPSPSAAPVDTSYYEERIGELTAQNETLRQDLYAATHFVDLQDINDTIIIELRYATDDNFTGTVLYPVSVCLLRAETAQKLIQAENRLETLGYRIKVWDAYRPLSVQRVLYEAVEDKTFIADPANGSRHNRGGAVDITLTDMDGNEVEMPSDFDDFLKCERNDPGMSETARANMDLLTSVMTECGFTPINSEWWHFDDSDWRAYPVLGIHLESFIKPPPEEDTP